MKKLLTILTYSFIIILLSSCWKQDDIDNIGTIESWPAEKEWLITTPWIEKQSYSNWFTQ